MMIILTRLVSLRAFLLTPRRRVEYTNRVVC
jgi:hypothetical protein